MSISAGNHWQVAGGDVEMMTKCAQFIDVSRPRWLWFAFPHVCPFKGSLAVANSESC